MFNKKKSNFVFLLAFALFLLPSLNALVINDTIFFSSVSNYTIYVNDSIFLDEVIVTSNTIEFYNLTTHGAKFENINATYIAVANFYGLNQPINDIRYSNGTIIYSSQSDYDVSVTIPVGMYIEIGDYSSPIITIYHPVNDSVYGGDSVDLNWSVDESVSWCAYSLDSGTNDTSIFNFTTNETINTTMTSLSEGSHHVIIYCNDSYGNSGQGDLTFFIVDQTSPTVESISPSSGSSSSSTTHNFTANLSDDYGLKNATLYIYNETGLYNKTTEVFSPSITQKLLGIIVELADSVYTWFYKVFDTVGNWVLSENRTLTIDTINPQIEYGIGTDPHGASTYNRDWVYVNVSVIELYEDTITFNLLDSDLDVISSNSYTDKARIIRWTSLDDGTYNYYVKVNDSLGHSNQTETRTIHVFNERIEYYPLFTGEITYSGDNPAMYDAMRSSGSGLSKFFRYMSFSLPLLIIGLVMVGIIVVIGLGIREAIMRRLR